MSVSLKVSCFSGSGGERDLEGGRYDENGMNPDVVRKYENRAEA